MRLAKPQPVVGIGTALLLWASTYRCSACVTESRHPCEFKSTTRRALKALPEYVRLEFQQDVYLPLSHTDESDEKESTDTEPHSRNRLLLTKP
jgi:hypothetical protein